MYNLTIDLESISTDGVATLKLDNINDGDEVNIDAYGYVGQRVNVDVGSANNRNVELMAFTFLSSNTTILQFVTKPYEIRIAKMTIKGSVDYTGGATIENLDIYIGAPLHPVNLSLASKITVKDWANNDVTKVKQLLKGVNIIPGCGKFALNDHTSLLQMKAALPNMKWIATVVAWFATNTEIGKTQILPAVEGQEDWREYGWQVANYTRSNAYVISKDSTDVVNYGGTINDASVIGYLERAKSLGFDIMFYPLLMVDMPQKPWRGHMTGEPESVERFYQEYKRFILHYANLVKDKVDAFLIGSELKGITAIATPDKKFPFVEKLIELASDVKTILGPKVKISYAADWSEYHTTDGCLRPLDELWASKNIDFVGIDAYFPLTHSKKSNISFQEIKDGWKSGEGIDFYLDRETKVPFKADEKWNHWKDIAYWWYSEHWVWDDIKKASFKTAWQPQMKPIWFTEFGFPSIDKAPNKPNVFFNPKAKGGDIPTFSNGKPDFAIQARALHATFDYWKDQQFVENMFTWCFDSRGENWTEKKQGHNNGYYYDDHALWKYGHWIDGKIVEKNKAIELISTKDIHPLKSLDIDTMRNIVYNANIEASDAIIIINAPSVTLRNCDSKLKELIISGRSADMRGIVHMELGRLIIKSDLSINFDMNISEDNAVLLPECIIDLKIIDLALITNGSLKFNGSVKIDAGHLRIEAKSVINHALIHTVYSSYDIGEKTHINEHNETIYRSNIKAKEIVLYTLEKLDLEATNIESSRLYIAAKEINFPCIITTYKKHEAFRGEKDWLSGARQSSDTHTQAQTPYPVQIISTEQTYIKSDGLFMAEGMKLKTLKLHMESNSYHFTGVYLDNSHAHHHKSKGGVFSRGSVTESSSNSSIIEGVLIIAGDTAYMIAHDTIWLEASGIMARKLHIEAEKIRLEALVGSNFHGMKVQKALSRLALTAGGGELSIGTELILKHHSKQHYKEYAASSVLTGQEVVIKSREIQQISSEISGTKGKIDVEEWHVNTVPLYEMHSSHDIKIRMRMAIGIRENVSGVVHGIEGTASAANQLGDNAFAGVNTALSAYSTVRAATNLMQAGLISIGPMVSVDASVNGAKMERITHARNMVKFETLETSIPVPDMSVPEDEISTSSYGISGGISNTGWNAFVSTEEDGVRAGVGYSHAWGNAGVFGNEVRLVAGSGDNVLDATWASMNVARFSQVWGDASLNSVVARTVAEVNRFLGLPLGMWLRKKRVMTSLIHTKGTLMIFIMILDRENLVVFIQKSAINFII